MTDLTKSKINMSTCTNCGINQAYLNHNECNTCLYASIPARILINTLATQLLLSQQREVVKQATNDWQQAMQVERQKHKDIANQNN